MEMAWSVMLGIGLSAACGFRVFVPLLGLSLAGWAGWMDLPQRVAWLDDTPALIVLTVAVILEVLAYFFPFVDNALDMVSVPAAFVAGTVATAGALVGMEPVTAWTLSAVLGGGSATTVKTGMAMMRGASSVATAGLANPVVSAAETGSSILLTVLAMLLPLLAAGLVLILGVVLARSLRRRAARSSPASHTNSGL